MFKLAESCRKFAQTPVKFCPKVCLSWCSCEVTPKTILFCCDKKKSLLESISFYTFERHLSHNQVYVLKWSGCPILCTICINSKILPKFVFRSLKKWMQICPTKFCKFCPTKFCKFCTLEEILVSSTKLTSTTSYIDQRILVNSENLISLYFYLWCTYLYSINK